MKASLNKSRQMPNAATEILVSFAEAQVNAGRNYTQTLAACIKKHKELIVRYPRLRLDNLRVNGMQKANESLIWIHWGIEGSAHLTIHFTQT